MPNYQSSNYIHSERQQQGMECLFSQSDVLLKTQQLQRWFLPVLIVTATLHLEKRPWQLFKTWREKKCFLKILE